jgi:hypothetical protein
VGLLIQRWIEVLLVGLVQRKSEVSLFFGAEVNWSFVVSEMD